MHSTQEGISQFFNIDKSKFS